MVSEHDTLLGIAEECHSCVLTQARSAARFAELNEAQTKRILAIAQAGLEESKTTPLLVQHIVRRVADAVILERAESSDFDITKRSKKNPIIYP